MNEWKMITRAVRSRWWVIVLVALMVTALGAAGATLRTEQYEATARVGVQVTSGEDSSAVYQGSLAAESRVSSYAELYDSERLLQIAQNNSGIPIADLRANVETMTIDDTVLFDVIATAETAWQAAARANAVAEAYPQFVAEMEAPTVESDPLAFAVVMDNAALPAAPLAPTFTQLIVLSAIAGLGLGLGLALLIDLVDKRIRRIDDIREVTEDVPVIGEIPESKRLGERGLVSYKNGYTPVAEAMRNLRTQIRFLGGGPQVLMVTSAMPSEGKSFIASNLSRSFVEAGEKVLLISGDLRAPTVESIFTISNRTGLSNVLAGQVDVEDVTVQGRDGDPDIIPTGPIPPNPSELLGLDRMTQLIANARKEYDVILIDASPVLAVTDSLILAPLVDAVVVISRVGSTTKPRLTRTLKMLANTGVSTGGIVANGITRASSGNDAYHLKYGYGYGYGSQHETRVEAPKPTKPAVKRAAKRATKSKAKTKRAAAPVGKSIPTSDNHQIPAGSAAAGRIG